MSIVKKMSISEIKRQVMRIEGFELKFNCGPRKRFETNLNSIRKTSDDTRVVNWIHDSFPNAASNEIEVILGTGIVAKRRNLGQVRASYPHNLRKLAKSKEEIESKVETVKTALRASKKEVRQTKIEVLKTVREINIARKDGEVEAGYDALDKALRQPDRYHDRVVVHCKSLLKDDTIETLALIEKILALWTHSETERDLLQGK